MDGDTFFILAGIASGYLLLDRRIRKVENLIARYLDGQKQQR